jgi:Domain of unknown function DUF1828/Domain of unknown function DUF1829
MTSNARYLIDGYYDWLKDKTALKGIKDWVEITTPFLDRHNDYIQLYLKQNGTKIILTDDSYTIEDLEQSGCSLSSDKRQKILETTLNGFGVQKNNNQLMVNTTEQNFALSKHNLIQAIIAVNDMFYLAKSHVNNLFFEDVELWLDDSNIRFVSHSTFTGRSGYNRHFDFVIPKSKNAPERMVHTVNNPIKSKADDIALGWLDTKEVRPENAKAYAFINDNEREVPISFTEALENYDVTPIPWSRRVEFKKELAA